MAKKEFSWEFILETARSKYFLIKQSEGEYLVFRPSVTPVEGSKNYVELGAWKGERLPWGSTPTKVRNRILRKKINPSPQSQDILISSQ